MQSCTLRRTGLDRYPSVFAASILFLIAVLGRQLSRYVAYGFQMFLSLFLFNISENFLSRSASIIYYFFFIILPVAVYGNLSWHVGFTENIRITPLSNKNCVLCALLAVPGVALALTVNELWCALVIALGGIVPETGTALIPGNTAELLGSLLIDAVLPAVCEEILFRGVVLSAWEEKGSRRAVLVTAVLFTLLHGSVLGAPAELLGGLIMGFAVLGGGSVFAGIIYHVCYNALIRVMQYIMITGSKGTEYLLNKGSDIMGIAAEIAVCAVLAAVIVLLLRAVRAAGRTREGGLASYSEPQKVERTAGEVIVITCSVIAALSLYAYDLADVLGVIKP